MIVLPERKAQSEGELQKEYVSPAKLACRVVVKYRAVNQLNS